MTVEERATALIDLLIDNAILHGARNGQPGSGAYDFIAGLVSENP